MESSMHLKKKLQQWILKWMFEFEKWPLQTWDALISPPDLPVGHGGVAQVGNYQQEMERDRHILNNESRLCIFLSAFQLIIYKFR